MGIPWISVSFTRSLCLWAGVLVGLLRGRELRGGLPLFYHQIYSLLPGRLECRALLGRAGHRDTEHAHRLGLGIERRIRAVGAAVPHTIRFDIQSKSVRCDLGTINLSLVVLP